MLPFSAVSKSYAAGFFDGEGCVYLDRSRNANERFYFRPRVVVSNTNREVLEKLQERWGGTITYRGQLRKDGSPRRFADRCRRQSWDSWHLAGRFVYRFLQDIQPYLVVKQEQAALILDYMESVLGTHGRLSEAENLRREGIHLALQDMKKTLATADEVRNVEVFGR